MSKKIDVSYVANRACLALTPAEEQLFQLQLAAVVAYVEQIGAVDVANVEPTVYAHSLTNCLREDVVVPSLDRERFMANAPDCHRGEFRLPKIVEDA